MLDWIEALRNAKARIALDKDTFEHCGRCGKGHARAMMLIDETIEDLKKFEASQKTEDTP
jgi:hypothetical protein